MNLESDHAFACDCPEAVLIFENTALKVTANEQELRQLLPPKDAILEHFLSLDITHGLLEKERRVGPCCSLRGINHINEVELREGLVNPKCQQASPLGGQPDSYFAISCRLS